MRRGIETDLVAGRCRDGCDKCCGRPLAVGPGNMDAAEPMLRVFQRREQPGNGGQSEFDAEFLEAVEIGNG